MPYISNGAVRLHYEVVGAGRPIILHTGGGGDGGMWRDGGYLEGLAGFQCILFDHRGHGRSEKPETLEGYHMERFVEDVVAVLDSLGLARVAFWGYSDGARVGYALAAAHPERVVGLVASGAIDETDRTDPAAQREAEELANAVRAEGMACIVGHYEAEGEPMTPWFRRHMLATDPEAFGHELLAWNAWHGPQSLLPQIVCPTLMLVGEREDPDRDTMRAAALMRNAQCVTLPGLDHITAYERSDLALAHAVPFWRGLGWEK
jgi:pimeloyl-ACP methyl ester carboxylesterase